MTEAAVIFTDELDQEITAAYTTKPFRVGAIKGIARKYSISTSAIYLRAKALNLPRIKKHAPRQHGCRKWTSLELSILGRNPHLSNRQLEQLLATHGFQRTHRAINIVRYERGWINSKDRDEFIIGYSSVQLEKVLGIDDSTIRRWIKQGIIKSRINDRYSIL
jgi:predicted DNA-binding transcriptional regulator AlpA